MLQQKCYTLIVPTKGGERMTELKNRIAFRCTDDFKENVIEMCNERGQTISDYITFLIMDDMANFYDEKGGEE